MLAELVDLESLCLECCSQRVLPSCILTQIACKQPVYSSAQVVLLNYFFLSYFQQLTLVFFFRQSVVERKDNVPGREPVAQKLLAWIPAAGFKPYMMQMSRLKRYTCSQIITYVIKLSLFRPVPVQYLPGTIFTVHLLLQASVFQAVSVEALVAHISI